MTDQELNALDRIREWLRSFRVELSGKAQLGETSDTDPREGYGVQHTDRRQALAFAYDGVDLVAVAYKVRIAVQWEEEGRHTVSWTPVGEKKREFRGYSNE